MFILSILVKPVNLRTYSGFEGAIYLQSSLRVNNHRRTRRYKIP